MPTLPPPTALCPACLCTLPPGTLVYVAYRCGERAPVHSLGPCDACGTREVLRTLSVPTATVQKDAP